MPARAIEDEDAMGSGRDAARDFGQVGRHRLGVDGGQDQACRNPARRADGPKQIGPLIACVARRTGSGATPGPDPGQGSLLPHAGFILEPDLDRFALRACGIAAATAAPKFF